MPNSKTTRLNRFQKEKEKRDFLTIYQELEECHMQIQTSLPRNASHFNEKIRLQIFEALSSASMLMLELKQWKKNHDETLRD